MSNSGQAVLGIVGAVVGFVVGGPTGAVYGFQLGYLAGTAIFPTQLPHLQGPRLGEGQQTVSVVGQPIPWVFGTQMVGGNIIWASPIREVANNQTSGKGSPEQSQTTYTYFRSFAILLCEGPIGGVRRIWANGKLIYDASDQTEFSYYGSSELLQQFFAGSLLADKMTIFLGSEDQMPSPVIESFEGIGNVPAHRGYAYVVFDDIELKAEDGNRIPAQWKFEVYEEADQSDNDLTVYSNEVLYPWSGDPVNPLNVHQFTTYATDFDSRSAALSFMENERGYALPFYLGYRVDSTQGLTTDMGAEGVSDYDAISVYLHYNHFDGQPRPNSGVGSVCEEFLPEKDSNEYFHTNRYYPAYPLLAGAKAGVFQPQAFYNVGGDFPFGFDQQVDCGNPDPELRYSLNVSADGLIQVIRLTQAPPNPCDIGTPIPGVEDAVIVDGEIFPCGIWEVLNVSDCKVLSKYSTDGSEVIRYPLNPARPPWHPQYSDEDFWTDAYNLAVARGDLPEGMTYTTASTPDETQFPQRQDFIYQMPNNIGTVIPHEISLASIVSRICDRVGATEYDVSDLEDDFVVGYQISRPMAGRAGIETLRSVGFFDVIESSILLKFPKRGKSTVATLTVDDLGAHLAGDERPSLITTQKKQELELPRQIRVHFQNPDRDLDPGEELSPSRIDTQAESVLDVDLAVAVISEKAARIAEVLQRDLWAGRSSHAIQADQSWSAIEPADSLLVPVDGRLERMRVPSVTDRLPNLRYFDLIRDDDGSYISTAAGTSSFRQPARIAFYGPVELTLLDLPPLTPDDNDAGIYAAVSPQIIGGSFRGAIISRSNDGGNYAVIGSSSVAVPMGFLVASVPEGPSTIFDEGTEIHVEMRSGELESRPENDVLDGANAAAIGADGRWEIIQFKSAVNTIGDIWVLTGLLRGRRGTEHAIGSSQSGDRFVMLSVGGLTRLPLNVSDILLPKLYKATVIGTSPEGVDPVSFTGHGIALKPFSPVHISSSINDAGNIVIEWIRRDRLASDVNELMSEATEDYEVDVLGADGEVLRTISSSTPSVTYSTDQQITDFGSVQESIQVNVYQISVAVGRGYAGSAGIYDNTQS